MTTSLDTGVGHLQVSENRSGENDCEVVREVTPELVQALDDLCALAHEMGREEMAKQCAIWTQQLRSVLGMDIERQKKALSEIWLG